MTHPRQRHARYGVSQRSHGICMARSPCYQVCERLAAAGVPPTHPVFRRAATALREAAEREPDVEVVRVALAAASRVEAPTYLGRGDRCALCTPHYVLLLCTPHYILLTTHLLLLTAEVTSRCALRSGCGEGRSSCARRRRLQPYVLDAATLDATEMLEAAALDVRT